VIASRRFKLAPPGLLYLAALVCLIIPFSSSTFAEEAEHEAGHAFARHDLAIFLGVTNDRTSKELTQGFEYEYRITSWFGAGGLVDLAFGEDRVTVVAVGAFFRPYHRLILLVAPGYERVKSSSSSHADHIDFLLRIGGAWEFEMTEKFYLAPTINVDFLENEEILVWGLNFGFKLGEPR